ncbi:hypothetical protein LguiA_020805 [Lonicera macranthoides]
MTMFSPIFAGTSTLEGFFSWFENAVTVAVSLQAGSCGRVGLEQTTFFGETRYDDFGPLLLITLLELKRSLYALFSQFGRILDIVALKTAMLRDYVAKEDGSYVIPEKKGEVKSFCSFPPIFVSTTVLQ